MSLYQLAGANGSRNAELLFAIIAERRVAWRVDRFPVNLGGSSRNHGPPSNISWGHHPDPNRFRVLTRLGQLIPHRPIGPFQWLRKLGSTSREYGKKEDRLASRWGARDFAMIAQKSRSFSTRHYPAPLPDSNHG